MENQGKTELERCNRTAMTCHLAQSVLITAIYLEQTFIGKRGWLYMLLVAVLALGPVACEFAAWSKDRESRAIRFLVAYGFGALYTVLLFTATNFMVFLYVLPLLLVISVYNDRRYSLKINTAALLENIVVVVAGAVTGGFGFRDYETAALQILAMVMMDAYSYFVARTSETNGEEKLSSLQEARDNMERVLRGISENSSAMQKGVADINEKVGVLQGASQMTKDAMEEVTTGASETADAVQRQLLQTETISQRVEMLSQAADEISENMQSTLKVLDEGSQEMRRLVGEVEAAVTNSVDTAAKMETLNQYIEEMNSIVELIGGITSQTSLLALNASIEAARAGEAGRGFAVVATEISALATQTKDATAHITNLIENVSASISGVVQVIKEMIGGINAQKEATERTVESFGTLESNTFVIRDNVASLVETVDLLKSANQEIADSVQTISAISEQVSAHANETLEAEERNMENLSGIAEKSKELFAMAQGGSEEK